MEKFQIEWVPIASIKLNTKNRNRHPPEQIERLAKNFEALGWIGNPIVVSTRSGVCVAGEGRYLAAKKCKMKEVPVHFKAFESDESEYAFSISDNALADWADLDMSAINADLPDLGPDFDLELLGIKDLTLDPSEKYEDKDADAVPEVTEEPISKPGDLWILGDHRVLCGDCTDKANIERLMGGEKADMVFTDPPYGMNLDTDFSHIGKNLKEGRTSSASALSIKNTKISEAKKYDPVINDHQEFDPNFIFEMFSEIPILLWGADYYLSKLPPEGTLFVWNKILNDNGKGVSWSIGSEFEIGWINRKARKKCFTELWSGLFGTEKQDIRKRVHPNQKPIGIVQKCFLEYGESEKVVLDLFLGSGSTLIACEKTGRRCFGTEIDPHYADVIVKRWETFTGKKAHLEKVVTRKKG